MEITNDCDIDAMDGDNDTVNLEESTSDTVDGGVRDYPIIDTNLSNFAPLHAKIPYKKHLNLHTSVQLNSPIYNQSTRCSRSLSVKVYSRTSKNSSLCFTSHFCKLPHSVNASLC
jgi:hypothetical protein